MANRDESMLYYIDPQKKINNLFIEAKIQEQEEDKWEDIRPLIDAPENEKKDILLRMLNDDNFTYITALINDYLLQEVIPDDGVPLWVIEAGKKGKDRSWVIRFIRNLTFKLLNAIEDPDLIENDLKEILMSDVEKDHREGIGTWLAIVSQYPWDELDSFTKNTLQKNPSVFANYVIKHVKDVIGYDDPPENSEDYDMGLLNAVKKNKKALAEIYIKKSKHWEGYEVEDILFGDSVSLVDAIDSDEDAYKIVANLVSAQERKDEIPDLLKDNPEIIIKAYKHLKDYFDDYAIDHFGGGRFIADHEIIFIYSCMILMGKWDDLDEVDKKYIYSEVIYQLYTYSSILSKRVKDLPEEFINYFFYDMDRRRSEYRHKWEEDETNTAALTNFFKSMKIEDYPEALVKYMKDMDDISITDWNFLEGQNKDEADKLFGKFNYYQRWWKHPKEEAIDYNKNFGVDGKGIIIHGASEINNIKYALTEDLDAELCVSTLDAEGKGLFKQNFVLVGLSPVRLLYDFDCYSNIDKKTGLRYATDFGSHEYQRMELDRQKSKETRVKETMGIQKIGDTYYDEGFVNPKETEWLFITSSELTLRRDTNFFGIEIGRKKLHGFNFIKNNLESVGMGHIPIVPWEEFQSMMKDPQKFFQWIDGQNEPEPTDWEDEVQDELLGIRESINLSNRIKKLFLTEKHQTNDSITCAYCRTKAKNKKITQNKNHMYRVGIHMSCDCGKTQVWTNSIRNVPNFIKYIREESSSYYNGFCNDLYCGHTYHGIRREKELDRGHFLWSRMIRKKAPDGMLYADYTDVVHIDGEPDLKFATDFRKEYGEVATDELIGDFLKLADNDVEKLVHIVAELDEMEVPPKGEKVEREPKEEPKEEPEKDYIPYDYTDPELLKLIKDFSDDDDDDVDIYDKIDEEVMSPDKMDMDKAYETFKKSYEETTGSSWSKEKFLSRAQEWEFWGDEEGFITTRKQRSGYLKLVGVAGNKMSILRGVNELVSSGEPAWGMVSSDIIPLLKKKGFKQPPKWLFKQMIKQIGSSVFGNVDYELNKDGSITFNYPDVGPATKFFIASPQYYKMLKNNLPDNITGLKRKAIIGALNVLI